VILDNNDSDEADARDNKVKGTSDNVDIGRIKRDTSLQNSFATSELVSAPTKSIDISGLWYNVKESCHKEPTRGLGSSEQHSVPPAPAQAQSQTFAQSFKLL
jgi:hypothetical protein